MVATLSVTTDLAYSQLPAAWDWTNVGGVNYMPTIRDQGSCASCEAYAVATAIEAQYKISLGQKILINAQSLFYETGGNCVTGIPSADPNDGAHTIGVVLDYAMTIGAPSMPITTQRCRLFRGEEVCTIAYTTVRYLIRGWGLLPQDTDTIKMRLMIGPLVTSYSTGGWIHVLDLIGWDATAWKTQNSYIRDPHPPLAYGAEIAVAWLEVPGQATVTTTTTDESGTSTTTTISTTEQTTTVTVTTTTTTSTSTSTTTTTRERCLRRNC